MLIRQRLKRLAILLKLALLNFACASVWLNIYSPTERRPIFSAWQRCIYTAQHTRQKSKNKLVTLEHASTRKRQIHSAPSVCAVHTHTYTTVYLFWSTYAIIFRQKSKKTCCRACFNAKEANSNDFIQRLQYAQCAVYTHTYTRLYTNIQRRLPLLHVHIWLTNDHSPSILFFQNTNRLINDKTFIRKREISTLIKLNWAAPY